MCSATCEKLNRLSSVDTIRLFSFHIQIVQLSRRRRRPRRHTSQISSNLQCDHCRVIYSPHTHTHMHTRTHTHKIYVYEHFFCSLVVTDSSETKQNDEKTLECGHRKDEIERQTFSHEYEALCLWPSLQLVIYAFININIFNKFPDEIRNEFHIVWTKMGRERDERFDERMGPEIITTAASAFNKWYDNCFVRAFVSSYHTHTAMYSIDYYGEKKHASKPRRALFAMPAALYSHCIGYTHSMAMNMRMTKHE